MWVPGPSTPPSPHFLSQSCRPPEVGCPWCQAGIFWRTFAHEGQECVVVEGGGRPGLPGKLGLCSGSQEELRVALGSPKVPAPPLLQCGGNRWHPPRELTLLWVLCVSSVNPQEPSWRWNCLGWGFPAPVLPASLSLRPGGFLAQSGHQQGLDRSAEQGHTEGEWMSQPSGLLGGPWSLPGASDL